MLIEKQIKKIHTSCKDCIFSFSKDNTITQTGCNLGILEYWKNKNVDIIECYDEEKEFYVINRKCFFKRNSNWLEKIKEKTDYYIAEVYKETKIKYMAIIYAGKENDIIDVDNTIKSLLGQIHQPSFIVVVRSYGCSINPLEINIILSKTGKEWRVSNPQSIEITNDHIMGGLLDVFWKIYSLFIEIKAGNIINDDLYMTILNDKIIFDDYKFDIIKENDFSVGNSFIHKIYGRKIDE